MNKFPILLCVCLIFSAGCSPTLHEQAGNVPFPSWCQGGRSELHIPGQAPRPWKPFRPLTPVSISASAHDKHFNPRKAFDTDLTTYWNGVEAPAWIEVDLGRKVPLRLILLLVEQTPNGQSCHELYLDHNTSDQGYRLAARLKGWTRTGQWLRFAFPDPQWTRHVRIRTIQSCSWVAWREIMIFAQD